METHEKPASEQLSDLASAVVSTGQQLLDAMAAMLTPFQHAAIEPRIQELVDALKKPADALYARMQAEEQERASMRALLADGLVALANAEVLLLNRETDGPDREQALQQAETWQRQARALLAAKEQA